MATKESHPKGGKERERSHRQHTDFAKTQPEPIIVGSKEILPTVTIVTEGKMSKIWPSPKKRIVIFGGRLASWRRCLFVDVTMGLLDWKVKTAIAETEKKTTEANMGNRGWLLSMPSLHGRTTLSLRERGNDFLQAKLHF